MKQIGLEDYISFHLKHIYENRLASAVKVDVFRDCLIEAQTASKSIEHTFA